MTVYNRGKHQIVRLIVCVFIIETLLTYWFTPPVYAATEDPIDLRGCLFKVYFEDSTIKIKFTDKQADAGKDNTYTVKISYLKYTPGSYDLIFEDVYTENKTVKMSNWRYWGKLPPKGECSLKLGVLNPQVWVDNEYDNKRVFRLTFTREKDNQTYQGTTFIYLESNWFYKYSTTVTYPRDEGVDMQFCMLVPYAYAGEAAIQNKVKHFKKFGDAVGNGIKQESIKYTSGTDWRKMFNQKEMDYALNAAAVLKIPFVNYIKTFKEVAKDCQALKKLSDGHQGCVYQVFSEMAYQDQPTGEFLFEPQDASKTLLQQFIDMGGKEAAPELFLGYVRNPFSSQKRLYDKIAWGRGFDAINAYLDLNQKVFETCFQLCK